MILEVDNKGANDLAHNWSIGGRTRHVDVNIISSESSKKMV